MVTVSPTFGEDGAKDIVSSPLQTGVFVAVGVDVGVDDGIVVGTDVGVAVEVDVETAQGVSIGVGVDVSVGVEVAVGDGVVVDVDVGACVGVVVATAVGVSIGVRVSVGIAVAVEVDVVIGVKVGVDVGVGIFIDSVEAVPVSGHSLAVGESPLYTTPATQIDKTTAIEMKRATVRNVFLGKSISLMIPHLNDGSYGSDDTHLFAGYRTLIALLPTTLETQIVSSASYDTRTVSPANFCLVSILGLLLIIKALG